MIRRTNRILPAFIAAAMSVEYCAYRSLAEDAVAHEKSNFEYFGSSNCQRCHFAPIQLDLDEGRTYFLGMNESSIWQTHDRHSKAFKLLSGERGQAMAQRLGWNVTSDQRCLSCHADWQSNRSQPDENVLAEGVACEACHGPSSRYANEHTSSKWRQLPLGVRETEHGMTMVRDPEVGAKVCLSCHIGNAEQGKVITHDMYAAGHPPLPSFSLWQFGDAMRHWSDIPQQLAKLDRDHPPHADATQRDLEFIRSQLGESSITLPPLKSVLVGGVSTLRESVLLLADESAGNVRRQDSTISGPSWPEFAALDCAMCHHDLHYPAWRQIRAAGSAGRPQIPSWPQALVGVAIAQVAGQDRAEAVRMSTDFAELTANLRAAFAKKPFGDPAAIFQASTRLLSFLDGMQQRMKSLKYDRPAGIAALEQLCATVRSTVPDYETARQLTWAFQSIYDSVKPLRDSATIDQELAALGAELQLSLNPLDADAKDLAGQAIADSQLQIALNRTAAYAPDRFQQHFQALAEALGKHSNSLP